MVKPNLMSFTADLILRGKCCFQYHSWSAHLTTVGKPKQIGCHHLPEQHSQWRTCHIAVFLFLQIPFKTVSIPPGQYLQVLLAVKHNVFGLHFSVFNVHFVAAEDDGNVLTDTNQVTVPVGYVLVSDSWSDIKHDDGTLSWRDTVFVTTWWERPLQIRHHKTPKLKSWLVRPIPWM